MSATEALKAARNADVELRVNGESLVLEACEQPPPEVIDLFSRHKPRHRQAFAIQPRHVVGRGGAPFLKKGQP
jgi:hypothetical protein